MKYAFFLFLLCALLLAGCAEETASTAESSMSKVSEQSVILPSVSEEESSFAEQTSEEIILPPDPVSLPGGITFTFPEGWENLTEDGSLLNAVSPDDSCSVSAVLTPGDNLTSDVIESKLFPELKDAWAQYGMENIAAELTSRSPGGTERTAIRICGVYQGQTVMQLQVYIPTGADTLILTLTTYGQDQTDELLDFFS